MKLSRDKCEFLQKSTQFLGQVVSAEGIRTCPKNVEAITSMKQISSVDDVKHFLGLVNFYAKFVPNLSTVSEPLNRLTRKGVKFQWTKECESAVSKIKKLVSSAPVLAHFQQSLPIGLACDASKFGAGVVLFHKYPDGSERPIAFASKSLSTAERNYSQIEREGLSIIFGIKRFFQFLYGRRFLLVTDHQPLVSIFGEKTSLPPLVATRLHRWALFLSQFQFDVIYRKTQSHGNADALSRLPLPVSTPVDEDTDRLVKKITEDLPVTSTLVRKCTSRDKVLSQVIRFVQNGWPSKQNLVPEEIRPYFLHREELHVEEGIVLWGLRVVIPVNLQKQVLSQLHETHPGMVRMKSLARQHVWWPHIDKQIEDCVKSCMDCCIHQDNPAVAPLHPWSFPDRPWQRLHIDLAGPFLKNMWLVVVDAHSKWPEVFNLGNNTSSHAIIVRIRETITRFGIPETIVSDNGPQFTSAEFQKFCRSNGIRHTTSSPYHPRSNGEAERFVKTFKQSLQKSKEDPNCALASFLLHYRVTPHSTTGVSPAESLLKVKPRTLLDLIKPDPAGRVRRKQEIAVESFPGQSPARQFHPREEVWVQTFSKNEPKWSLGTVIRPVGPVSYDVQVGDKKMKRHVDQMLSSGVTPFPVQETSQDSPINQSSPEVPSSPPPKSPEFRSAESSPGVPEVPRPPPSPPSSSVVDDSRSEVSTSSRTSSRARKQTRTLTYGPGFKQL